MEQSEALAKAGVADASAFLKQSDETRKEILMDLPAKEYARTVKVAQSLPTLEVVDAKFQVVGEKIITPGSFVQLIVKVRVTPPSSMPSKPIIQVNGEAEQLTTVEEGEEKELDELIGRKKAGSMGETPDCVAHAPYFPVSRMPSWYVFVGDHKLGRVFVPPVRFTQFGYHKMRTLQMTFQAPPNPGLYNFQTYI